MTTKFVKANAESLYQPEVSSKIATKLINDSDRFGAPKALTHVPVDQRKGEYTIYTGLKKNQAKAYSENQEVPVGNWDTDFGAYACQAFAAGSSITDAMRNTRSAVAEDPELTSISMVSESLSLNLEQLFADRLFKPAGSWGSYLTEPENTNTWDHADADPVADVRKGRSNVRAKGGNPNVLVLSEAGYEAFIANARVRDQFKYTSSKSLGADDIAGLCGVDRVVVLSSVINSAEDGQAEDVDFQVSGAGYLDALVMEISDSPSTDRPTAAGLFHFGQDFARIEIVEERRRKRSVVQGDMDVDVKIVAPALGCGLSGMI